MKLRFARNAACVVAAIAISLSALSASADEPVWPADFAEQLAANLAAARPGEGQSGASDGIAAIAMRKLHAAFSGFVHLRTEPTGCVLFFW